MQMDTRRLILTGVFAFSLAMLWNNWSLKHAPAKVAATTATQSDASGIPQPVATPDGKAPAMAAGASASDAAVLNYSAAPKAIIQTDNMIATVSAQGGDIIHLELTKHKATNKKATGLDAVIQKIFHPDVAKQEAEQGADKNYVLFQESGEHTYVADSGVFGGYLPNPNRPVYELVPGDYKLKDGQDKLEVRMKAPAVNGVTVTKVLTFHRNSYVIDVRHEIDNASGTQVKTTAYFEFRRDGKPVEHSSGMFGGVSTFTGPAVFTQEGKFQKIQFEDIAKDKAKYVKDAKDGWVAMVQHYFVAGYLPKGDTPREFFTRKISDNFFGAGVTLPVVVEPGKSASVEMPLYAGPQEQDKIKELAPGFDRVVDYGWVTIFAEPVFWLLSKIHSLVNNWGWSIILVTVVIKLLFFPLSAASYRSMAKMKTLMPRMKQIQERFANDKMRQNQEMMELYKREKVNPMGGCFPMLIQIPVFFALYWVLLGVVEMRQAPWLGWILDLSVKDPYYILPLIMGATMLIQTRLNPSSPDPVQAKVMMAMPIVFTAMFLFFPSGLVLYYVVNNTLSIAQQWYITRMIQAGGKAANS